MAKFFSHYDPPQDVQLECKEASLTLQEYADESDLNKIMEKYAAGMGALPVRDGTPMFGDFSDLPDFATAQQIVIDAQDRFDALPARLRDRFDNDPGALIAFLQDENNRSEAVALGLIPSKQKDGEAVIGGGSAAVAEKIKSTSQSPEGGEAKA